jgi:hypothetical protein
MIFDLPNDIPMRRADFRCSARSPASTSGAAQLKKQNVQVGDRVSAALEDAILFDGGVNQHQREILKH